MQTKLLKLIATSSLFIVLNACSVLNLESYRDRPEWQNISKSSYQRLNDSDLDGVIKAREMCADTKVGHQVDNYGCSTLVDNLKEHQTRLYFQYQEAKWGEVSLSAAHDFLSSLNPDYKWSIVIKNEQKNNVHYIQRSQLILSLIQKEYPNLFSKISIQQAGETLKTISAENTVETPSDKVFIVYFDNDSAKLNALDQQKISEFINAYKSKGTGKLYLSGHASMHGENDYNQALSEQRSQALIGYLTAKYQIQKDTIDATAMGEEMPLVIDETEEAQRLNRRVEMIYQESAQANTQNDDDGRVELVAQSLVTEAELKWHIYIMEAQNSEMETENSDNYEALGW
ncbi:OmpA family protein [Catenovulum sediminis]|uniref:OmpA family protein n=1 Tax=Catenovulum sediminis TaxID=1740262 RepID=A0ABV1RJM3_9ALTE